MEKEEYFEHVENGNKIAKSKWGLQSWLGDLSVDPGAVPKGKNPTPGPWVSLRW